MYSSFNARAVGLSYLTAAETIDLAAGIGFEGVDLLVRDLLRDGDRPAEIRARIEDRGLPAPDLNWSRRIGINVGVESEWRVYAAQSPAVSGRR